MSLQIKKALSIMDGVNRGLEQTGARPGIDCNVNCCLNCVQILRQFFTTTLSECTYDEIVVGKHRRDIREDEPHEASSTCNQGGGWSFVQQQCNKALMFVAQ